MCLLVLELLQQSVPYKHVIMTMAFKPKKVLGQGFRVLGIVLGFWGMHTLWVNFGRALR